MVIAGIIALLVIAAGIYFLGLPLISGSNGTDSILRQYTTLPSPTLTQLPTTIVTETTLTPTTLITPTVSTIFVNRYIETYNLVYSVNRAFVGGQKEVFTQDLTAPPLYIMFNITPEIEVGEKIDDIGRTVNTSYISPNSWFKVSIYDADYKGLVEQQGFNKGYGTMTQQEFMIRAPGNYRVEMTGNDVIAEVQILTGKSS